MFIGNHALILKRVQSGKERRCNSRILKIEADGRSLTGKTKPKIRLKGRLA